jgi:hypothetical protein
MGYATNLTRLSVRRIGAIGIHIPKKWGKKGVRRNGGKKEL